MGGGPRLFFDNLEYRRVVQVEAAVEAGEGWRTVEMTRGDKPRWRQRMEEGEANSENGI